MRNRTSRKMRNRPSRKMRNRTSRKMRGGSVAEQARMVELHGAVNDVLNSRHGYVPSGTYEQRQKKLKGIEEDKINNILAFGFLRPDVVDALVLTHWDVEKALVELLDKSLSQTEKQQPEPEPEPEPEPL